MSALRRVIAVVLVTGVLGAVVAALAWPRRAPQWLEASGTVEATEVAVGVQVGGRVAEVLAEEGAEVGEGQPLLRLDSRAAELQVRQARAALDAAEASLANLRAGTRSEQLRQAEEAVSQAQAVRDQAAANLETVRSLLAQGAATQSQLDAAATQARTSEAAYAQALAQLDLLRAGATSHALRMQSAQVEQARAALELAELHLEQTTVASPSNGVLVSVGVEPGEVVPVGAAVAVVADLSRLWIRVYVPEADLGKVSVGQRVKVRVDAFPGQEFSGRVAWISSRAEFTPKNVQTREERVNMVFAVKVALDDSGGRLKPGMPADVTFPGQ
ncbi:MAG: efflux RND transporter periplasmic adaptor subunit [Acetobacteraceae bacterium]|nr:efflux RND transporter periplasmic adaptor subunit [Acetobacteraceae bacterium]